MSELHPLIDEMQIFVSAGVFDVLSAKLAERAGFKTVVVSGYAVAASYLGEPDIGLLTQTEILDVARRVCRSVDCSVIVDGDTGHGGVHNVVRLVQECIAMGARGILLEDQVWPKKCGHMEGHAVIATEAHCEKIRAARHAKGDAPFLITARTDARSAEGLDEAIARGTAYKEAGADLIFIEAPRDIDEMRRVTTEVPGPLVANMIDGGKTPILELDELHALGYLSVGYVLTGLFAAAKAMENAYAHLLREGTSKGLDLMAFDDFTELLGLEEHLALDTKFKKTS